MTNSRWQTAIHESGHICVAHFLGAKLLAAEVREHGGIACFDGLNETFEMFATAAGPAAERLLGDTEPPAETPLEDSEPLPTPASEFACTALYARRDIDVNRAPSDAQRLAWWSIRGVESEPQNWAKKLDFANTEAERLVWMNRENILRVARDLYASGTLWIDQLYRLLEPTK